MTLSRFDHRLAEVVVVEVMIAPEIEQLPLGRPAVEDDVGMRVRAILVESYNIVKLLPLLHEKLFADLTSHVANVFSLCANGKRHNHMCGMAELRAEFFVPVPRESICNIVNLFFGKRAGSIMDASTVDDVRRLSADVA